MYNTVFENNYTNIIEPIYGKKRNSYEDSFFATNIVDNHTYSINMEDRLDMTEYQVYSIDPEGCEDADDAFSIYTKNEELFFYLRDSDNPDPGSTEVAGFSALNPFYPLWCRA